MDITFELITGVCFGISFLGKDPENEIDESIIVLDLGIFRLIFWLNDSDDE